MREDVPARIDAPLHLEPLLVPKPWGGRRLERFGRRLPPGELIGESWEVADLGPAGSSMPDPVTRVAAGPLRGASLQQLITRNRVALLGEAPDVGGRFPLLVKLLDAREHLSVQVHPPAAYVAEHPGVALKTESWVVLDADPAAQLLIGVTDGVTPRALADAAGTPTMVGLLRRVPARPGEVHHLPAGTIHALGAGVLVAEVQTPSDTTFRLYDWAREHGRAPRELHLTEALESIDLAWEHNVAPATRPAAPGGLLVDTPEYRLVRRQLPSGGSCRIDAGLMRVVQGLSGTLEGDGFSWALGPGGTIVLPAAWAGALRAVDGPATWLEATVPPTKEIA